MTYSRKRVLDYFRSLTPDSRPMRPGVCPIGAAVGCDPKAATGLDPWLAGSFDRLARERTGSPWGWSALMAGEIVAVLDAAMPEVL